MRKSSTTIGNETRAELNSVFIVSEALRCTERCSKKTPEYLASSHSKVPESAGTNTTVGIVILRRKSPVKASLITYTTCLIARNGGRIR